MKSWSTKQPLAEFVYDYLCDLVHPNKGSNLTVLVKLEQGIRFDVDGPTPLGISIFDKIFPLVVRLCADEFGLLVLCFATLGTDEDRIKDEELTGRSRTKVP
jgi:hypothetical protein